jgi:Tol biopolymer transport system component
MSAGETLHLRPTFLPDGHHFLFRSIKPPNVGVYVASLDSPDRTWLLDSSDTSPVVYANGHLLFVRDTTLMAQPFDVRRLTLTGEPVPVAEQLQPDSTPSPLTPFSVSDSGILVYQTGRPITGSDLRWFDRTGKLLSSVSDRADYREVRLSPDNKRAAVSISDPGGGGAGDLWLIDLTRGLRTRFTSDPADDSSAIWSPDGDRIVFSSPRNGHRDMYVKPTSGAGSEVVLLGDDRVKNSSSWSPDGQNILFTVLGPTWTALWRLSVADKRSVPFIQVPAVQSNGQFSPDGRWVAYQSNESGRQPEIYIAPFPGPGGKTQVSLNGGSQPLWRRNGTEMFFLGPDLRIMVAAISIRSDVIDVGQVNRLSLSASAPRGQRYTYDVSADGQRFLIISSGEEPVKPPPTVVVNWTAALKK